MASRRMIGVSVMMTDGFLSLSSYARLIYPYLILSADDYGMVNNSLMICNMQGVPKETLDELRDKKYIIKFPSGVYAITHWFNQNRQTRKSPFNYQEELSLIKITNNSSYELICEGEVCKSALDYLKEEEAKKSIKQQNKKHDENM